MCNNDILKRDIRDIFYFVDHVKNLKLRESALVELGYQIGYNVVTSDSPIKTIIKGKQNEYRIQIEDKIDNYPLVKCAIVKNH